VPPRYRVEAELGRGGMGVVYRAADAQLGWVVALKMILAGGHAGERHLARFRAEAAAVAAVAHPNVVQVFDAGEHAGNPYLVLEYVPGGTLTDRLAAGPLAPADAARLVERLADALHAAHDCGVVHRDLKPANVLFAADGTPKVTDFGVAKRLDGDSAHTQTGEFMGTPAYMSPEQARAAPRTSARPPTCTRSAPSSTSASWAARRSAAPPRPRPCGRCWPTSPSRRRD
jgi:serine/threonine-protein kinase